MEVVHTYGEAVANGILGAIRMIMVGNSYGLALSAFKSRRKGQAIESSSLSYEMTMLASIVPLLPVSIVRAIGSRLLKEPIIQF